MYDLIKDEKNYWPKYIPRFNECDSTEKSLILLKNTPIIVYDGPSHLMKLQGRKLLNQDLFISGENVYFWNTEILYCELELYKDKERIIAFLCDKPESHR